MSALAFALLVALPDASAQALGDLRRTPVVEAVERATPAVVTVQVEVQAQSPFAMFDPQRRASEGSGVVIDASGVVLTNAHVVDGAQRIAITLRDGRSLPAELVAADPAIDLAVLRVPGARGLEAIALGDSSALLLGEPAIAIGNPYGLGLTVSTGVVASVARDVNVGDGPTQTYIQTDAAINPGNSGGALVNAYGELIGVNTFIHSAAEGIGFAIPVNRAVKIAEDLLQYGQVQVPWLGAAFVERGRRRGAEVEGGLLVARVLPGGPAVAAGVLVGDVIVEVDGHRIATRADLHARLAEKKPGERVRLGVVRARGTLQLSLLPTRVPADLAADALRDVLAVTVVERDGVLVVTAASPGGSLAAAGLRAGDVLLAMDGQRLRTAADLSGAVGAAWGRHRAAAWLTVARGGYQGTVQIGL